MALPRVCTSSRVPCPPLLGRLLLALGSIGLLTLVLVGFELGLRRWSPDYLVRTRGLHVFSSIFGWAGRPGAVGAMGHGRVRLNERGYRGPELPPRRPGDRIRAVVLGDSIAFGYGVSDEEAFPQRLEVRDNVIAAANLGVSGYGPGQELLVLLRDGLRQDPDVVLLAFCLRNDFVDAVLPVELYDGVTPRPRFVLQGDRLVLDDSAVRLSPVRRVVQWLSDESHLFNRVSALVGRRRAELDHDWRYRKQQALRDEQAVLRVTVALVLEMDRVCRDRGVAFLVATFPNGLGYGSRQGLGDRLERSLETRGVPVVDMAARFRALGLTPAALALDRTGHLGAFGHQVSAEILEREIGDRFAGRRGSSSSKTGGPAALSRQPEHHQRSASQRGRLAGARISARCLRRPSFACALLVPPCRHGAVRVRRTTAGGTVVGGPRRSRCVARS